MRQIDNMTPQELDTLALKGMTAPRTASERTYTDEERRAITYQNEIAKRLNKAQHSPLPWSVYHLPAGKATGDGQLEIQSGELILVAYTPTEGDNPRGFARRKANSKLIVRAVNHAEALAEALRRVWHSDVKLPIALENLVIDTLKAYEESK